MLDSCPRPLAGGAPGESNPRGSLMLEIPAAPVGECHVGLRPAYERDGYIVLRGLFGADEMVKAAAEADALLERCRHLISVRNLRCRWQTNVQTGTCDF